MGVNEEDVSWDSKGKMVTTPSFLQRIWNSSYERKESIDWYFSRMLTIKNEICIHGDKLEDVVVLEKILWSKTKDFAYVICLIDKSKNIDKPSIYELQSSLLVHKQRMKNSYVKEKVLKVSTNGEFSTWKG